ncbi:MAG: hypothetical protein V1843_05115 [bacterium]
MSINTSVNNFNNIKWLPKLNINNETDNALREIGDSPANTSAENSISDNRDSAIISSGTVQASAASSLSTIEESKNPNSRVCIAYATQDKIIDTLLQVIGA